MIPSLSCSTILASNPNTPLTEAPEGDHGSLFFAVVRVAPGTRSECEPPRCSPPSAAVSGRVPLPGG